MFPQAARGYRWRDNSNLRKENHMAESVAAGRGAKKGTTHDKQNEHGKTPAQWYCYVAGALLTLLGLLGFIADSTFDTGGQTDGEGGNAGGALQGDSFIGFEVNGWHNVMHLVTGLLLLAFAGKRRTAKPAALAIGVFYLVVALIGFIDGNDVLSLIPVNGADNVLHLLLGLLGIGSALASDADDRELDRGRDRSAGVGTGRARAHEGDATVSRGATSGRTGTPERAGRGNAIPPEDHDETRGRR